MSKSIRLHNMAEKHDISIYEYPLELSPAASVHEESNYYIAMDSRQLETNAERTVALAHEVGHCRRHAFYNIHNNLDIMERHELKANKWAVPFLIPKRRLLKALELGIREVYDLAEYFGVTENFMRTAIDIYALDEEFVAEIAKTTLGGYSL